MLTWKLLKQWIHGTEGKSSAHMAKAEVAANTSLALLRVTCTTTMVPVSIYEPHGQHWPGIPMASGLRDARTQHTQTLPGVTIKGAKTREGDRGTACRRQAPNVRDIITNLLVSSRPL